MGKTKKKNTKKIPVEVEFTEGYEQRFTKEVLKIYSKRSENEKGKTK